MNIMNTGIGTYMCIFFKLKTIKQGYQLVPINRAGRTDEKGT